MSRRAFSKTLAAAVVAAGLVFALRVDVGTAQDDLVRIEGRMLGIAGQTMVVAPYASGAGPINVDLSQASQDEYMALRTGDSVTGRIPEDGHGVMATSIQGDIPRDVKSHSSPGRRAGVRGCRADDA